jgi:PleD family two-component response regulator
MVESIDQLLDIADRRLYMAKNSGRNRICVSDDGRTSFA